MATPITLKVDDAEVDVVSVKINQRTINQGHSLFVATVDNFSGGYAFDANDDIEILTSGVVLFKGSIDSVIHARDQEQQWDLTDFIRLKGRDLSSELSDLHYTRTFPPGMEIDDMISEAISGTGSSITIAASGTSTIDGHTSIDEPLLSLVTTVLERADYRGYVDFAGELQIFERNDVTKDSGVTLTKSNVLNVESTPVQGEDIRNSITVLGALTEWEPETGDLWTEDSLTGWEQTIGSGIILWSSSVRGSNSVMVEPDGDDDFEVTFTPYDSDSNPITIRVGYHGQNLSLQFWGKGELDATHKLCLHTDASNYFETDILDSFDLNWDFFEFPLGTSQINTEENPDGIWTKVGDPDWLNITYLRWYGSALGPLWRFQAIDGLAFGNKRTHGFAENSDSITSYDKRELIKIVDATTNAECQSIATDDALRLGEPVSIIKVVVPLDALIVGGVWKGLVGYNIGVSEAL